MGIYDREYYQDDNTPRGFNLGGQRRMMVTNIVLVTVAVFIVDMLTAGKLTATLGLNLNFYRRPWLCYQLLTYGFIHAGPWHIALNMFMLWMFGRVIEERLGRREFLLFYLAAIVFAGLTWVVMKNAWLLSSDEGRVWLSAFNRLPAFSDKLPGVVGASGGVVAVFVTFVLYYPKQTLYLWGLVAIPAWVVGALVIGGDILRGMSGAAGVTAWEAHLGGAAFAFLYLRLGLNFSRLLPATGSGRWKMPRRKPNLRLHNPDNDQDLAAEADRILAKVHREGEQSLTGRERRTLEKYSRSVRDRRH